MGIEIWDWYFFQEEIYFSYLLLWYFPCVILGDIGYKLQTQLPV